MRKYLAALMLLLNAAAQAQTLADPDQAARATALCEKAILPKLKDPDSAKFSRMGGMTHERGWYFPLMVRARNSYGGMADPVVFSCYLSADLTRVVDLRH